jgi:endoglucanase
MTKLLFLCIFACAIQITVHADIYPRYNHAGYAVKAAKSCIILSDENLDRQTWTIQNKASATVLQGTFIKSLSGISGHTPMSFNYEIEFSGLKTEGKYKITIGSYKEFSIEIKNNPTDFLVPEMVNFLKKQRSGVPVAPDNEIGHSGDIKCRVYVKHSTANTSWDTAATKRYVDMLGGWYDAGDYLKFTQTIAYTTYFLLRTYDEYPTTATSTLEKKALMEEALWGLQYLLKTMPDDSTFIIQVGNAEDHKQGQRMPYHDKLNGLRHAYSDFSPTQMGLTAASLALAANIFESTPSLKIKAQPYREKAIQIYKKAIAANKVPAWFEEGWEKFYNDQSSSDNMELAAVELYELTQNDLYLEQAKAYALKAGPAYWYSWGNINMTAHLRLYPYAPEMAQGYLTTDLTNFNNIAKASGNIWRLPHNYTWATLYSFLGVASTSIQYKKLKEEATPYDRMGTDVLNYTLGQNNWNISMIITDKIPGSVQNIFSQMYTLNPIELSSVGAVAEGPGDKKTHDELMKYFNIPTKNNFEKYNTQEVVFYDYNSDFQCMETSIGGMADAIYFFTLIHKTY